MSYFLVIKFFLVIKLKAPKMMHAFASIFNCSVHILISFLSDLKFYWMNVGQRFNLLFLLS